MRYVALLRAINVGGRVVKMERLRQLFQEAGFSAVSTHIASGNVLFQTEGQAASDLEKRIESCLQAALGFSSATFLRTSAEMEAVSSIRAFAPDLTGKAHGVYAGFLKEPLTSEQEARVLAFSGGNDQFLVAGREIHWLCRERSDRSIGWPGKIEKTLKIAATFRNITTVREISAKLSAEG